MGLTDSPLCRRCETEEETSAHLEFQRVKYLGEGGGKPCENAVLSPLCSTYPFSIILPAPSLSLSLSFLIFEYQKATGTQTG
jgi:hypothetical protein